jgi:hypothetical protein
VTYKFKVQARNSYGLSAMSDEVTIICATVPSTPAVPTTMNLLDKVVFDWDEPASNGLPITSYTVLIRGADNQYYE